MAIPTYNKHVLHRNARAEYCRQLLLIGVTVVFLAAIAAVVFAFVNNRIPAVPTPSTASATTASSAAQTPSDAHAKDVNAGQSGDPSVQAASQGAPRSVPVIKEGA